jgi:hypothetical protein
MSVEAAFTYSSHTWLHVLSRSTGREIIPLILTLQCQLCIRAGDLNFSVACVKRFTDKTPAAIIS